MKIDDPEKYFKEIGHKISSYRKDLNLTQLELAKKMNVSQQLIATYEKGSRKLPILALFKISEILKISFDELLGLNRNRTKPGPMSKLQRQFEQLKELPQAKQKIVIDFLDTIIKSETIDK